MRFARQKVTAKWRLPISVRCCVVCREFSTSEIDNLIDELRTLREKLLADGNRVERDIVEYAALSQSVIQMTKIITESMTQVKKLPIAPTLAD